MKPKNNPFDKNQHAPGRGSDKQHPETPSKLPTGNPIQDHPERQNSG